MNENFTLFNLVISTHGDPKTFVCNHIPGDNLKIVGENIYLLSEHFSLYAIGSLIPIVAAKQRKTDANDWMTSDEYIACPDPLCGARFKIERRGTTKFNRSDVTKTEKNR